METIIGKITIFATDKAIYAIKFGEYETEETALKRAASVELSEYFEGKRKVFDLPLELHGTEFQKAVWNELLKIPYGKTLSYEEIAKRIGNPHACRAVGMANNKNPMPIIIPCHRVIAKSGLLQGYAEGIFIKKKLLDLEHGIGPKNQ